MSRLIQLFARLYPRSWRERYGAEFSALLEDVGPDAGTAANVLSGALAMQVRNWKSWKIFAASAVFGAVVVAGLFSTIPNSYTSSAVVKISKQGTGIEASDVVNSILVSIEGRGRLTEIITRNNLYLHERSKMPLDEVIDQMKRDVQVRPLGGSPAFAIRFTYTDPHIAQQVTSEIAAQFLDENFQQRLALLQILDGASLPKSPVYPNKALLIGVGIVCSLVMWGGLSAWRSVSARRFAADGPSISSGGFAGGAPVVSLSLPPFREHLRRKAWAILVTLALLIAVGVLSFKVANPNYESSAVIKILPRADGRASADYIASLAQSVESPASLAPIIADYNLYRSEYHPENVFERMKEHIRIEPLGGNSAFSIRFAYPDRHVAQKVAQELALQIVKASAAGDSPVSLSVLDSASLPESWFPPVEADYSVGLFFGLLLGATLAVIVALFRRQPTPV